MFWKENGDDAGDMRVEEAQHYGVRSGETDHEVTVFVTCDVERGGNVERLLLVHRRSEQVKIGKGFVGALSGFIKSGSTFREAAFNILRKTAGIAAREVPRVLCVDERKKLRCCRRPHRIAFHLHLPTSLNASDPPLVNGPEKGLGYQVDMRFDFGGLGTFAGPGHCWMSASGLKSMQSHAVAKIFFRGEKGVDEEYFRVLNRPPDFFMPARDAGNPYKRNDASEQQFLHLCKKQEKNFGNILRELQTHRKKVSHWAWWVWPTELAGRSEPLPSTRVTQGNAHRLFYEGSPLWKDILEVFCDLCEKKTLTSVLPSRLDQGRVEYFIRFWADIRGSPLWFTDILDRLASRFGVTGLRQNISKRALEKKSEESSKGNAGAHNQVDKSRTWVTSQVHASFVPRNRHAADASAPAGETQGSLRIEERNRGTRIQSGFANSCRNACGHRCYKGKEQCCGACIGPRGPHVGSCVQNRAPAARPSRAGTTAMAEKFCSVCGVQFQNNNSAYCDFCGYRRLVL